MLLGHQPRVMPPQTTDFFFPNTARVGNNFKVVAKVALADMRVEDEWAAPTYRHMNRHCSSNPSPPNSWSSRMASSTQHLIQ